MMPTAPGLIPKTILLTWSERCRGAGTDLNTAISGHRMSLFLLIIGTVAFIIVGLKYFEAFSRVIETNSENDNIELAICGGAAVISLLAFMPKPRATYRALRQLTDIRDSLLRAKKLGDEQGVASALDRMNRPV